MKIPITRLKKFIKKFSTYRNMKAKLLFILFLMGAYKLYMHLLKFSQQTKFLPAIPPQIFLLKVP